MLEFLMLNIVSFKMLNQKLNILLTWLLIFLVYTFSFYTFSVNKETTMYGLLF